MSLQGPLLFFGDFGKNQCFSDNRGTLAIESCNTSAKLMWAYEFKGKVKSFFCVTVSDGQSSCKVTFIQYFIKLLLGDGLEWISVPE